MGFSRQEYWSGLPFPPPGHLPDPGIESVSPALAGRFFTTVSSGKSPWRRKWQLIPVFLPEKSHRQRNLVGYRPWGLIESDMTEWLSTQHANVRCWEKSHPGPGCQHLTRLLSDPSKWPASTLVCLHSRPTLPARWLESCFNALLEITQSFFIFFIVRTKVLTMATRFLMTLETSSHAVLSLGT